MDELRPPKPWFVTFLACLGWVSLVVIPQIYEVWYQSQDPDFVYHALGRVGVFMGFWFIFGVILVALDTFRRKASWEKIVWGVAAASFGLPVAWLGLSVLIGDGSPWSPWYVRPHPAEVILTFLFVITALIGNPVYTLLLTFRAIRSWATYPRVG